MTFLEAKKIVEDKGYHVVKNSEGESFRERVAREEAKRIITEDTVADRGWDIQVEKQDCDAFYRAIGRYIQKYGDINYMGMGKALYAYEPGKTVDEYYEDIVRAVRGELEEAMKVVKQAGLNVINENDLTNFAQFDSNGNINASQDFEDDKMILSANFNDNTDDEDMSPYDAELTIQFKKKFRTAHHVERHIYNSLCRKLQQFGYTNAMDDSYNNGKTKTLKFNFFFDDNTNAETIINIMVRSAKLWTAQLGESLESDEDLDELDEGCCGCGGKKKKGKKKGKKSDFVPFWAKKKDKVDEALEDDLDLEGMTLDEAITLDEGFGTAGGTPLSQLCADYIQDDYFTKLANEVGLEVAKAEFLEKAREVTGDKYYKTLSARIQAAKTATAVLFVLQGTMFGGSNMDLAAGTRQSAYHRNRR